jgi:carbamoyl-phosphate synthase large subunit
MNVQYAIKDGVIYVLEVNPRASRTVPFVAKTIGARSPRSPPRHGRREAGRFGLTPEDARHIAVKEAVFPFARFPGVDTMLGRKCARPARSSGSTRDFAHRLRQEPARRRRRSCRAHGTVFVSVRTATRTDP